MSFSERMGLVPERQIQVRSMDDKLRNRLYNFFMEKIVVLVEEKEKFFKDLVDKMGELIKDEYFEEVIKNKFLDNSKWYNPYEIIEYAFEVEGIDTYFDLITKPLNEILSDEKSGYRFVNFKFVPFTDETEIEEIKTATNSKFYAVDKHISKALSLYSDRKNPDYENSIKESISAVESMCGIITGMKGKSATLGNMIDKLKDNGVHIHGAMVTAFDKLYGYTSDEDGIRHGGIDFKNAPEEDARYMLVSCSAFVNYLKDKYSKSKSAE